MSITIESVSSVLAPTFEFAVFAPPNHTSWSETWTNECHLESVRAALHIEDLERFTDPTTAEQEDLDFVNAGRARRARLLEPDD